MVSVPIHITGFWAIRISERPELSGSVGAGLNLGPRIFGEVIGSSRPLRVTLNGSQITTCMTSTLAERMGGAEGEIRIYSPVPLGVGFAVSAAISLITAYGLSYLKGGGVGGLEPAVMAHNAEVECRTGLGDVIAQYHGGALEARLTPGAPGHGTVVALPVRGDYRVFAVSLGKRLDTPTMLSRYGAAINRYGASALEKLMERPSLESFLNLSRSFSRSVGMTAALRAEELNLLESLLRRGYAQGYYVKKNVLVVVSWEDGATRVFNSLYRLFGEKVWELFPESHGLTVKKV